MLNSKMFVLAIFRIVPWINIHVHVNVLENYFLIRSAITSIWNFQFQQFIHISVAYKKLFHMIICSTQKYFHSPVWPFLLIVCITVGLLLIILQGRSDCHDVILLFTDASLPPSLPVSIQRSQATFRTNVDIFTYSFGGIIVDASVAMVIACENGGEGFVVDARDVELRSVNCSVN